MKTDHCLKTGAVCLSVMLSGAAAIGNEREQVETSPNIIRQHELGTGMAGIISGYDERALAQARTWASEIVDMETALRLALDWHPYIAQSVGRMYQRNDQIDVARSGYYPKVRGGLSSGYDNSSVNDDTRTHRFDLSASQMLYDFGKVSSDVRIASAGVDASRGRILLAIDDIGRETAHAVIELRRNYALLQSAQAQVKGVAALADLARERSSLGASTRSDVVQAQSREEAARAMVLQTEAQLGRWTSIFQNLVGGPYTVDFDASYPTALAGACDGEAPDWSILPAVIVAEAERNEAVAGIERAKADAYPTLSVDAGMGRALNNPAHGRRNDFSVSLNMSMSLFEGGAISARRSAAGHALRTAEAARDNARLRARQALLEARDLTRSMAQRLELLDDRQKTIAEARTLYEDQYLALGTRTLLDLLNAEQELHQAVFDKQNTRHDLYLLQVDCLYNSGRLRAALGLDNQQVHGVEIRP